MTGPQSGRVGCYEVVWADGAQVRMTFSNTRFTGATPKALDPFYVLAPQTDTPQGAPPNTFPHDHVVRGVPSQNHGQYSVQLQGFFVLCSGQGIVSGACVPRLHGGRVRTRCRSRRRSTDTRSRPPTRSSRPRTPAMSRSSTSAPAP